MQFLLKQIDSITGILKERMYMNVADIENVFYSKTGYLSPLNLLDGINWEPFDSEIIFSGMDNHFLLKFSKEVTKELQPWQAVIEVNTGHNDNGWNALNPQMLVFLNGKPVQGVDVNHRYIYLYHGQNEIVIYAHTGMLENDFKVKLSYKEIDINTQKLYYDLITAKNALETLGVKSQQYYQFASLVKQAIMMIDINSTECNFYDSAKSATLFFEEKIWSQNGVNTLATVSFIGHTHIDVAWLWTLSQTAEKAQRSCATVLNLMDKYPDYIFFLSQPVLYEFVKKNLPDLYEKIKQRVKEGLWEVEGSMWLEADCNLSGGESLIRQILYGKKFFKEEFDVDNEILWLPDAFGFTASLPQILKKSNIKTFITSKLSWSETNKYPHDLFMWKGIDGSEVLAHFITARDTTMPFEDDKNTRYNGYTTPSYVLGAWQRFQDKPYSDEVIVPFGYGDGGGSADEEMLEMLKRTQAGMPGFPKVRKTTLREYSDRIHKNFKSATEKLGKAPKWFGELYLELHRGTFTTMSEIKKYNRFCEFLYQKAEQLSILNKILFSSEYPKEKLDSGWKNILLNQFHDVLPGSSVKEVYNEAFEIYDKAFNNGTEICNDFLYKIADNVKSQKGVLVYNANSFKCSDYVYHNGEYIFAEDVPAMGWKVFPCFTDTLSVVAEPTHLENSKYKITFDDNGNIISIYDKRYSREIVKKSKIFNVIEIYENAPYCFDAWEISEYYKDKCSLLTSKSKIYVESGSNYAQIVVEREFSRSSVKQVTRLFNNSDRIDFILDIDWHEEKTLLKAGFPLNVHSDFATFDIQFGSIVRPVHANTSWEKAKFEVCGHKWVDVSEDDYGISIINNSKYGYSYDENEIAMSLLTSPKYPNPDADMGKHTIEYSLLPHTGGARNGKVVREGYKFNQRLSAVDVSSKLGTLDEEFSFVNVSSDTVIIETVKQAEDGSGIILRLYQSGNKSENIDLDIAINAKNAYVCDMMENTIETLKVHNNSVNIPIAPFEIITLKFSLV